jgi:hypothetical protein
VKLKKGPFKPFGFKLTLDVCSLAAGGRHPVIKTFMGPDIYEQFDKVLHPCPYGVSYENVSSKLFFRIPLLFLLLARDNQHSKLFNRWKTTWNVRNKKRRFVSNGFRIYMWSKFAAFQFENFRQTEFAHQRYRCGLMANWLNRQKAFLIKEYKGHKIFCIP